jgi:hypothetical protein
MALFEELCVKYGPEMNSQPALVAAERTLKQKITIMCLVALVSGYASVCSPCDLLAPVGACVPMSGVLPLLERISRIW